MRRMLLLSVLAGMMVMSTGCGLCQRRQQTVIAPAPRIVLPPPPAQLAPPPPAIQQSGAVLPPGAYVPPNASVPPVVQPPTISKSPKAPEQTQWQPADGSTGPPRIEVEPKKPPRIQLYAPEPIEKKTTDEPPLQEKSKLSVLPPIAQFAVAKEDRIYTGLRPKLDGLDWLRDNGVKTVINIRLPGKDDSADRTQIENRNMRYVAFEISPRTLTKEKADEFIKLIRQTSEQRVFVYDEDGSLAGSMWYVFMRLGVPLDDDAAQINARQLGLDTNRDGPHRDMWLAVQKLVSENNP